MITHIAGIVVWFAWMALWFISIYFHIVLLPDSGKGYIPLFLLMVLNIAMVIYWRKTWLTDAESLLLSVGMLFINVTFILVRVAFVI